MEFKDNPGILAHMRFCLKTVAKMKNIKLEHPPEEYDMETMLKMMEEMEEMPIYYSPKERLLIFKDNVIWFCTGVVIWGIRKLVFVMEKVSSNSEIKAVADEFRAQHDKDRTEV